MHDEGLKLRVTSPPATSVKRVMLSATLGLAAGFCIGCRSIPPLPSADFSAPGWHVRQGQAVWKPAGNRLELAGELLLATNANGNFLVQFTKTPFPLATAQVAGENWQIEFGSGEHSWRGRGRPPSRFVWFQLPAALTGEDLQYSWKFSPGKNNSWRLENPRTGESLEGEFFP